MEEIGISKLTPSVLKRLAEGLPVKMKQGVIKLIVDKASDKVVGCHMVGEHAAEIIQGIGIAIKAGATKADFDATVGIHPSAAEEFVTMREPSR